jgi:hypothetical protein
MKKIKFSLSMLCFLLFSLACYISSLSALAQIVTIGGPGSDYGYSISKTNDGGYIIAATTTSYGYNYRDFYIVKLDANLVMQWAKTFDWSPIDWCYSIIQTSDSGFALIGQVNIISDFNSYLALVKLVSNGNLEWSKIIQNNEDNFLPTLIQTSDEGYAILCMTSYFYSLLKFDKFGNLQWSKSFHQSSLDLPGSIISLDLPAGIIQTSDGGYAVTGYTNVTKKDSSDIFVLKLDANGKVEWFRTIGGNLNDYPSSILQTTDGGYVVAGSTYSFGNGGEDVYVIKLDSSGNLQWTKTIGGPQDDWARWIFQTNDGGYAICGTTMSYGEGGWDAYVIKLGVSEYLLDAGAYIQWTRTFGGESYDYLRYILQNRNNDYILVGTTSSFGVDSSDILIVKMDSKGNVDPGYCGSVGEGGIEGSGGSIIKTSAILNEFTYPYKVVNIEPLISTGGVQMFCSSSLGVEDEGGDFVGSTHKLPQQSKSSVQETNSPIQINFSLPYASNVSVRIYNLFGQEIATVVEEYLTEVEHRFEWRPEKYLPPGVYFARIQACNKIMIQKIILE